MRLVNWIAFLLLTVSADLSAQQPIIYSITDGQMSPFVSLSQTYDYSEVPDSLAIPPIKTKSAELAARIELKGKYRKRFFQNTKLTEDDKLFIYDYKHNKLLTLPVKTLPVIAHLTYYSNEPGWKPTQDDCQLGFELDEKILTDTSISHRYTLVSIGQTNPFVTGKLKPITWQPMAENEFAFDTLSSYDSSQLETYNDPIDTTTYKYEWQGLNYFVRDFMVPGYVIVRQLVVADARTNKPVFTYPYGADENMKPTIINYTNPDYPEAYQWTGYLLSGKPPVILGLENAVFGCPNIYFLPANEPAININCDNRP